jgi:hypothetical protein
LCREDSRLRLRKSRFTFPDATALCRGGSRWRLRKSGLTFPDATALCRGGSRWLLKTVALLEATTIHSPGCLFFVATNVNLHGARPWHPKSVFIALCSSKRETPRHKAVASSSFFKDSLPKAMLTGELTERASPRQCAWRVFPPSRLACHRKRTHSASPFGE